MNKTRITLWSIALSLSVFFGTCYANADFTQIIIRWLGSNIVVDNPISGGSIVANQFSGATTKTLTFNGSTLNFSGATGSGNPGITITTTDAAGVGMYANATSGFLGTFTNHPLSFGSNNNTRVTLAADGSAFAFVPTLFSIRASTSDGSDNGQFVINAGGALSQTRGAGLSAYGNEHASEPGDMAINTGTIATSDLELVAQDDIIMRDFAGNSSLTVDTATRAATFGGAVTSSATGALGWTPVAAANQACNTTCTSACVFGIDSAAPQTWLACTDATADQCLCAGAS